MGAEEAFDIGQLCRGVVANVRGYPLHGKEMDRSLNSVPLTVVVDAKDVHDKANSDTSSFGSQKSLAFTIAWLRAVLSVEASEHLASLDLHTEYVGGRRDEGHGLGPSSAHPG